MSDIFIRRFAELETQLQAIKTTQRSVNSAYGNYDVVDSEMLLNWKVKVESLLINLCGNTSSHFTSFREASILVPMESNLSVMKRQATIFAATKEDFEGGYLTSLKKLVQADVFDSELEQAQELLNHHYVLAAAVIAGVVLETAIRDLCDDNGIAHGKLDAMNAELARKNIYSKLQQKQITALAAIRNSAAHGKPDEFKESDVANMIRDVERFLIEFLK